MPGTDPAEALRVVFGELPDLPYLPELPGRGPGADLTGRTAALLIDLPVVTTPTGWRFTARPGRDLRRAHSYLAHDLDSLEEIGAGYAGPLKIQVCGPWTLAATIELSSTQNPALTDPGAVRDIAGSLAEAVAAHTADVAKRVPGARLLLQLDEPALPAALAGSVPTASGFGRVAAVDGAAAEEVIRGVLAAAPESSGIVHCCGPIDAPLPGGRSVPALLAAAGARAVSFDLTAVGRDQPRRYGDTLAELVDGGTGVLAGVAPALPPGDSAAAVAGRVAALWRQLGLPPQWCAERVVLTPACGLAGAPPAYATAVLACCREAARAVRDELEG